MLGLMQESPLTLPQVMERAGQLFAHKTVTTATAGSEVQATFDDERT